MRIKYLAFIILGVILVGGLITYRVMNTSKQAQPNIAQKDSSVIRYIPVGDSYTIGNGVREEERWPNILTKHLNEKGLKVELIENLAVSGYTTEDALAYELPEFERQKPDFATLFIGANDNFVASSQTEKLSEHKNTFRENLIKIIERMQKALTKKENLVLITIPDYSKSPQGRAYQGQGDYSFAIKEFNDVIKEEGSKRNLKVVDLFPLTQNFFEEKYFITDGLHPSPLQHEKWEEVILPVVLEVLSGSSQNQNL